MPEYHPCLRLTLQSRRQIESNKSPLPCSLCALALNTGKPPVRTNRGSLLLSAAGIFRPRLGSMEFGFWGLRRVGREGDALLVPGGQRKVVGAALLVFLAVQFR